MNARTRLAACFALAALALSVRGLYFADGIPALFTADQDGTRMARRYDDTAVGMLHGEGILFPKIWDPARTGQLSRPPGYPMFLAAVYASFGRSFPMVAVLQDVLTSLAVFLAFAIGHRLSGVPAGLIGAILVALSPQIAATSNLILADSIASLPLLVGFIVAVPVLSGRSEGVAFRLASMGFLLGVGVWLRPNVLALAPLSSAFLFFLLGSSKRALQQSALVSLVALAVVAPITIRNWLVFGEFVPVSINGGITLWQGVADAGGTEYGARMWDKQVMAEEAERYHRPDYLNWWAEPDGIARDRDRYRRATDVITARPVWYARAMLGRMWAMLTFRDGPPALLSSTAQPKPSSDRVPLSPDPDFDVVVNEKRLAERMGLASFLRAPLGAIHGFWWVVPIFVGIGVVVCLRRQPRVAVYWLIVPIYFLLFESPFLYEWRVAVPMQYFLLPFVGAAIFPPRVD